MGFGDVVENGKISSTHLGIEDHGIFTANIHCDFDGSGQGFGGYGFDEYNEDTKDCWRGRKGSAFGVDFLIRLLQTLEKDHWEDLPGTPIRVKRKTGGGSIIAIGHFFKDQWFNVEDLASEHQSHKDAQRKKGS